MTVDATSSAASIQNPVSILMLRKTLDAQKQAAAQLIAGVGGAGRGGRSDGAQISDAATRLYQASIANDVAAATDGSTAAD